METTKWNLDKAHSEIKFKARHLMISKVTGSFGDYDADVETQGDDFSTAKVSFSAVINSVNTGNEQRDTHLKSPDFFDAENHPKLSFVATNIEKAGSANQYHMNGDLTIRGVTKPVRLNVELEGIAKDPWGNTKAGLLVHGKVNRKEFGLNFHVVNEAGNLLVSDDINIEGDIQLAKA